MTSSEILNSPTLVEDIAGAIGYSFIKGHSILVHKKSGDFKKADADSIGYMVANQGWIECVSAETLKNLLGFDVKTSDDGLVEAEKIVAWMRNADNDPMGLQSY